MPLLDTRAVTNADSGLLKEEQDAFLSSLSHLLHDLAASLKPQSKVHPGARAAEFFEHLECTFENQPTVSVCVHVDCSSTLNILQLLWMLFIGLCLYHIYFVGVGKLIYSYMWGGYKGDCDYIRVGWVLGGQAWKPSRGVAPRALSVHLQVLCA